VFELLLEALRLDVKVLFRSPEYEERVREIFKGPRGE
jgi:hypothetical protein